MYDPQTCCAIGEPPDDCREEPQPGIGSRSVSPVSNSASWPTPFVPAAGRLITLPRQSAHAALVTVLGASPRSIRWTIHAGSFRRGAALADVANPLGRHFAFTPPFPWNDCDKITFPDQARKYPNPGMRVGWNSTAALNSNKLANLRDRVRGQFFGNLGDDAIDDFRVKSFPKIAQSFRRSDDDEALEMIGVGMAIERLCNLVCKALLGDVMPIDLFHGDPCPVHVLPDCPVRECAQPQDRHVARCLCCARK